MKRMAVVVVLLAAVLAGAAGLYFWKTHRGESYAGLAAYFPARTELYVETSRLGQWLDLPPGPGTPAAAPKPGADPLLQVLGQVWAAEPLKPQELPVLLQNQPAALGLWRNGGRWEGAGFMPLAPGQRAPLDLFFKEKLGEGNSVKTAGGLALHVVAGGEGKDQPCLLWGVDDQRAVVASSTAAAEAFLNGEGATLEASPAFRKTVAPFGAARGALLYAGAALLADLSKPGFEKSLSALTGALPGGRDAAPLAPAPVTPDGQPEGPAAEGALAESARKAALELLSLESLSGAALWTAPPEGDRGTWDVAASLGFAEKVGGVWKLAASAGTARPTLAERVPRDGETYLWAGGFDLPGEYRMILDEAGRRLPPDQMGNVRAVIGLVEGKLDLSLANDLLPTLGDESLVVFGGEADGPEESGDGGRWAVAFSLKDARRFESLVGEKVAKAVSLKPTPFPGARGWTWGDGKGPTLLVTGGVALLTGAPRWALATGGDAGKAWKRLAAVDRPVSGVLCFAPGAASPSRRELVFAAWTFCREGVVVRAEVPGKLPRLPLCEKPAAPVAGEVRKPGT